MRILVAIIAGVLLAAGSSVAVVNASTDKPAPRPLPIYSYGAR